VYDLSNKRRLGLTEWDAINEMRDGVLAILEEEKKTGGGTGTTDPTIDTHLEDTLYGTVVSLQKTATFLARAGFSACSGIKKKKRKTLAFISTFVLCSHFVQNSRHFSNTAVLLLQVTRRYHLIVRKIVLLIFINICV